MTLDCVLLKDKSLVFALGLGPKISSVSLSLSTTKIPPPCPMLVIQPVSYLSFYTLPRDPLRRLSSNIFLNRTVSCELVGDFVS
jgi:hypothetical protein